MNRPLSLVVAAVALLAAACASAQTTLNQSKATAGGITSGDAPGFPIEITRSGSYRLTGNLTVPAGAFGIIVEADDVTIDLNGFTIRGPVECTTLSCNVSSTPSRGIAQVDFFQGMSVYNGTVRGFDVGIVTNRRGNVRDVHVSHNLSYGLIALEGSVVEGVVASLNRNGGIYARRGVVSRSQAHRNLGHGFVLSGSQLLDSQATNNGAYGLRTQNDLSAGKSAYGRSLFSGNVQGSLNGVDGVGIGGNLCAGTPC